MGRSLIQSGKGLPSLLIPPLIPTMGMAACTLHLNSDRTLCCPAQRSVQGEGRVGGWSCWKDSSRGLLPFSFFLSRVQKGWLALQLPSCDRKGKAEGTSEMLELPNQCQTLLLDAWCEKHPCRCMDYSGGLEHHGYIHGGG